SLLPSWTNPATPYGPRHSSFRRFDPDPEGSTARTHGTRKGGAVQEPAARRKSRPSGCRRSLPRHPQPRLSACAIVGRADAGCRRDQEKSTQTTPLERSVLSPQIYWVPAPEGARLAVMPCPRGHEWLLEELS